MVEPQAFRQRHRLWGVKFLDVLSPLARAYAGMTENGPKTSPSAWRKGLILGFTHIGDVLWRTCSLNLLRQGLPECDWYYLASPDSAPLLKNNPALKGVIPLLLTKGERKLKPGSIRMLRDMNFDVALCTEKYGYVHDLLLAIRLGIPNRVAYTAKGFASLVTYPVPLRLSEDIHPRYIREYFEHVSNTKSDVLLKPKIYLDEVEFDKAKSFVEEAKLDLERPVIAIFRKGRTSPTGLIDRQVKLAIYSLVERYGAQIVLCGTQRERPALELFSSTLDHRVVLCAGELDICSVAAFLGFCHCILTPDSGPRHIGNAVGTPVVFVPNIAVDTIENNRYCDNEVDLLSVLGLTRDKSSLENIAGECIASIVAGHMKPARPVALPAKLSI